MNIALLGFGTVGKAFYELTLGRSDLRVTSVLSRRPRPELPCTVTNDFDEIVRDRSVGIVVEVMGGLEPAYRYICAAMRAGKHVVTANKQLVCAHYDELLELARECGVSLRCTAAAGGGIPWLTSLSRATRLDEITVVGGILNGTTNYMLSAMTASGVDYTTCLREAQALGYAEADPTADVEGYDARRKLVLSANLAFGASVREEEIPCILCVNKIDTVEPAELLPVIAAYNQAWDGFDAIIPISAHTGSGLKDLMKELRKYAQEGPQLFPDGMTTDQPERQVMGEILREKLLLCLDKEIPHGTAVEITKFSERDSGVIDVDATIYCEKASHKGIIIGKQGAMLKKISSLARQDMEKFMGTKVYLETWVKVKENWRDNVNYVRSFGYRDE